MRPSAAPSAGTNDGVLALRARTPSRRRFVAGPQFRNTILTFIYFTAHWLAWRLSLVLLSAAFDLSAGLLDDMLATLARPTTQKLFLQFHLHHQIFPLLKLKTNLYSLFKFNFNSNTALLHSKLIKTTRKHSLTIFDNRPSCQKLRAISNVIYLFTFTFTIIKSSFSFGDRESVNFALVEHKIYIRACA